MAEGENVAAGFCFEFTITEPKKSQEGGGLSPPHWSYLVLTKTNLPQLRAAHEATSSYSVRRRFNDFAWLRDQLVFRHPGCLVPPIPEKKLFVLWEKVMGGSEPTAIVEHRMRAMRKFLVRVGAHELLQRDEVLHAFLTLSDESLKRRIADTPPKHDVLELPFHQRIFKDWFRSDKTASEETAHWDETLRYIMELEAQLQKLRTSFEQTAVARTNAAKNMQAFGRALAQAGSKERKSKNSSSEVDLSHSFESGGVSLESTGGGVEDASLFLSEQGEVEHAQIVETLVYYCGMCGTARDTIKRLQRALVTRDTLKESIASVVAKRDACIDGDRKVKLGVQVQTSEEELQNVENLLSKFQQTLRDELTRFHREKAYDIKQLLSTWVDLQREYGARASKHWAEEEAPIASADLE